MQLDRGDARTEMTLRRGSDHVPLPHRQRRRDRTGRADIRRAERRGQRVAHAQPHGIVIAAMRALALRRQCHEADARTIEQPAALGKIVAQPRQLAPGEQPHRLAEVERGPGQVLWMAAHPTPADQPHHRQRRDHRQRGDGAADAPDQPRSAPVSGSDVTG